MGSAETDALVLAGLRARLPELRALLERVNEHWTYEDGIYRLYHQSFKVYTTLQPAIRQIVAELQAVWPDRELHPWFLEIVAAGTSGEFESEHNRNWLVHTRPIAEAFFHARFMLEMAVKYGGELEEPPQPMPSGWAAILYLYQAR